MEAGVFFFQAVRKAQLYRPPVGRNEAVCGAIIKGIKVLQSFQCNVLKETTLFVIWEQKSAISRLSTGSVEVEKLCFGPLTLWAPAFVALSQRFYLLRGSWIHNI